MTTRWRTVPALILAAVLTGLLSACGALVGLGPVPTGSVGGAVDASRARMIAARVVAAAVKADATPTSAGDAARRLVYTGDALAAATADARLAATTDAKTRDERVLTSAPPIVLAVSRGLTYPRTMVVQTTRAKSGLPVLYLLTTPDVRTPYQIASSAPMLPGASVKIFDPLTQGSLPLGSGTGLSVAPMALTTAYAASLAFPPQAGRATTPTVPNDSFAQGVRASAGNQSKGMNGIGTFTQVHTAKDVVGGLRVIGGAGALVFVAMNRSDSFLNRTTGTLKPSKQFTALTGLKSVTSEANLSTLEIVVFAIPDAGPAVTVAADEHLYAASGI